MAPRRSPERAGHDITGTRRTRLVAIAAILIAVVGVAALIAVASGNHGRPKDPASATGHPSTSAGSGPHGATAPSSSAPDATGAPASSDLGDQSDPAALVAALRNLEIHGGSAVAETILSPPACAPAAATGAGLPSDSRALVAADVRWKGQDAQALVFADSTRTNGQTAVVVTPTDCAVLTSIPF